MPTYEVTSPDGKTWDVTAPDGATQDQVLKFAQSQWASQPKEQPATVQIGSALNQIPRQLGLTARYAIEGPMQAAEIVTEPIRQNITDPLARLFAKPGVSDIVKGTTRLQGEPLGKVGSRIADFLGLPRPVGANERVVGDMTRMGFGSMGAAGAFKGAANATSGATSRVLSNLAANPGQQAVSAVGAGGAAGASREAGAPPEMQAVAGLVGGIAAPVALSGLQNVGSKVANFVKNRVAPEYVDRQVDNAINLTLSRSGINWDDLDGTTRQSLRRDARQALANGGELSGEALRRLADYRRVGATPTSGGITLDPVQITREKNLAKLGANSSDRALQQLAQVENQNNAALINSMNDLGAERGDVLRAGENITSTVLGRQSALRGGEQAAWDAARGMPGYRQPISSGVISDINRALGEEGQMAFMDPRISRYMEAFQTGQQPFTPQDYRNLQSMLSKQVAAGGNEGAAARTAQRVLMQADVQPVTNPRGLDLGNAPITADMAARVRNLDAAPQEAIGAVNRARQATRQAYAYEESTPLVRSVLSDSAQSDPQRIAKRFVIDSTPNEARMLADEVGPNGLPVIRDALLAHLKDRALNGAADEVGNFSQSNYNKALEKIGDRKLALFFSPEEIGQLRAVGRAASYMQFQPRGSAVNNSNSGALMLGKGLDMLATLGAKVPLVNDTITGVINNRQATRALSPSYGLLAPQPQRSFADVVGPSLVYGGLLAAPQVVPNR